MKEDNANMYLVESDNCFYFEPHFYGVVDELFTCERKPAKIRSFRDHSRYFSIIFNRG